MALPKWITPAGNLGIVPELEYYEYDLDAYDASGGVLVYSQISGRLPPGIQVVTLGKLQGIPVSEIGPDKNEKYSFTIRVTNTTTKKIADRTFDIVITNVSPPVIISRRADLGIFFDGQFVDIQLTALEFIVENNLTWTITAGDLPSGLTLSPEGSITGYIDPILAVGPSSTPNWDATPWDQLGWQFSTGYTSKTFKFTVQVTDGVGYDSVVYDLKVYPKNGLTADTDVLTADTTYVITNTDSKHYPIILSTQSDLAVVRQGRFFSFQVKAIDLDGDALEYLLPATSEGAFDENQNDILPYLNELVTDGNIHIGTVSGNKPAFFTNDTIQVRYLDPGTNQTKWHQATVTNYTTVRLLGNTTISGTTNQFITQPLSGANATIRSISVNKGTLAFTGNSFVANIGDYVTQGTANAIISSGMVTPFSIGVTYLTGNFVEGFSNVSINGIPRSNIVLSSTVCYVDVGATYNNSNTFTLAVNGPSNQAYINGTPTKASPTTFTSLGVSIGALTDQSMAINYDMAKFDQGAIGLPLLLRYGASSLIDSNTGWITGVLPDQVEDSAVAVFDVTVRKKNNVLYSTSRLFTLSILGGLEDTIEWITPSYIGSIENGKVCDFSIKALSSQNKNLYYYYTPGKFIRLPQGLTLLPDGLISGRVSFELFKLDRGTTTLDNRTITFDNTYSFSVTASDYDNLTTSTRTFTIKVIERNDNPYENLYLKAFLTLQDREDFLSITRDQSIFPLDLIYRNEDPFYGITSDIKALFLAGLNPSLLSEYADAVEFNHSLEQISFSEVKTAVARDNSYDVIEIATGHVIGTYQNEVGFIPTDFSKGHTSSNTIPDRTVLGEKHIKYEVVYVEILDTSSTSAGSAPNQINLANQITNPYYDLNGTAHTIAYSNSFSNMESSVVLTIGYTDKGILPDWMTSLQPNGNVIGFKRAIVIAYTVPGASKAIAWRYAQKGYNLNNLDFTIDRYQLDNSYTANYDVSANSFIAGNETTFDRYPTASTLFNTIGSVDYAINNAYETINHRSVSSIVANGGFDGITNIKDGQTLVFFQQEFRQGLDVGDSYNQGWSNSEELWDSDEWDLAGLEGWDQSNYVPGYNENLLNPSVVNERAGIWRININAGNIVSLTFVQEIVFFDRLYVRYGFTHGGTHIYYNSIVHTGNNVPTYSIVPEQINISSTQFDNNGTRFLDQRDNYTVPGSNDKYIKFAKTGVFT